jgi:hypothetical protein
VKVGLGIWVFPFLSVIAVAELHPEDLLNGYVLSAGEEELQCDPMESFGFLKMRGAP